MVAGDGGCEAYTVIVWGVLLSLENHYSAEAETVSNVEGNMCDPVMRGVDALPWSKTTITHERSTSEPGRSRVRPERQVAPKVRIGKVRSRSR